MEIEIRSVALTELDPDCLNSFTRYQVTRRVKYLESSKYLFKDDHFVEDWDEEKKAQVILDLKRCLEAGGFLAGAFGEGSLVGFANIENKPLGSKGEYLELPYIHVSSEYRGRGIGKKLFRLCSMAAMQRGAGKLYIAAHPAEETQQFYTALGCVPAREVIEEILAREPRDIQLEFFLNN